MKKLFAGIAILVGGGLFVAMGYSMWVMKSMMENMNTTMAGMGGSMSAMRENMGDMAVYMKNMGAEDGYMKTMARDMADMRTYMLLMAGSEEEIQAYRERSGGATVKATPAEMAEVHATCQDFLAAAASEQGSLGGLSLDEIHPERRANESYMASMRRDMNEMDKHIFCMYLSMSADMAAMRQAMSVMTPSVASMGPTMGYMGRDMNRGVDSFTSPMGYMFNAIR